MLTDAGETGCGERTLLIFQTMKTLAPGQRLYVLAYNLAATMDIRAWCRPTGNVLLVCDPETHPKRFLIQKQA
jgi:TusA-related sulfurtransferase